MRTEIINTGSELMLGRVLNTHQQWLCRQLADLGLVVDRQVAVDDAPTSILAVVKEALDRAELILVTGGLGPTSDDRTRDLIAGLLGRALHEDAAALANIERFFLQRRRPMPPSTRVQAMVPEGATVLMNTHGTAPGLVIEAAEPSRSDRRSLLIMLPGPPRELRPMFTEQVVAILRRAFPPAEAFICRTLRTSGIGESILEERIAGDLEPLLAAGLEVGYCARVGEVDVRFIARGPHAQDRVAEAERAVRARLGEAIYGVDDDQLETIIVRDLTSRRQTLALAESCTGGLLAHRITNVPGASAVLLAGLVTYSNAAKQSVLGVRAESLTAHGAVSEVVAREMAEGARQRLSADYAISVTGIAGPAGGSEEKPVGTVWMAVAGPNGTVAQRRLNPFDRETFKSVASQQALELLRREMRSVPAMR